MSAGKIKHDWYDGARCNGTHEEIEGWFSEQQNALCDIDCALYVWAYTNGPGHWLDQDRIDDICARIDANAATEEFVR